MRKKNNNSRILLEGRFLAFFICITFSCRNEALYKSGYENFNGENVVCQIKGELVSIEYRSKNHVYLYNDSIISHQIERNEYLLKSSQKFEEGRFYVTKYDSLSYLPKRTLLVKENLFTTLAAKLNVYFDGIKLERLAPRIFKIPDELFGSEVNCEIVFEDSTFKYVIGIISIDSEFLELMINVVNPYGGYLVPFTETNLIDFGDSIKLELDGEDRVLYKTKRR
jgi:hypothetical protein